jgi:hypothetical protein
VKISDRLPYRISAQCVKDYGLHGKDGLVKTRQCYGAVDENLNFPMSFVVEFSLTAL